MSDVRSVTTESEGYNPRMTSPTPCLLTFHLQGRSSRTASVAANRTKLRRLSGHAPSFTQLGYLVNEAKFMRYPESPAAAAASPERACPGDEDDNASVILSS